MEERQPFYDCGPKEDNSGELKMMQDEKRRLRKQSKEDVQRCDEVKKVGKLAQQPDLWKEHRRTSTAPRIVIL